jgi:PRTRC genetic system protein E
MFTALHQLAQSAPLLVSIAAEGENLRVTVSATSTGKTGPAVHPLVLVGAPDELDRDFAQAVQIFEPSALPLLEQARAAANANGNKDKAAAKAPKSSGSGSSKDAATTAGNATKRGPGRPPKNAAANPPEKTDTSSDSDSSGPDGEHSGAAEVDPRQMSLVDTEAGGTEAAAPTEPVAGAAEASAEPSATPSSTDPRNTGLDLPI